MAESLYGNERKIVLENRCSPERYEQIVSFLSAQDFHILNASYWHAEQPWEVPTREVSDNLIVIVDEYMPSEPHGEGDIAVELLEKISARRKMMPSGV